MKITEVIFDNVLCTNYEVTKRGRQVAPKNMTDHKWTLNVLVHAEMGLNNIHSTSQITLESH
jgi:hypothetical protein